MAPLPHRLRKLSVRGQARSQREALALRKEVRDGLDTALLPALERAFDEAAPGDALVHLPAVHVRVRVSGKGDVARELAAALEQELRKQLGTAIAEGRERPALAAGRSGAEAGGRAGLTGGAPSAPDLPTASERATSFEARVQMLLRYLETGSVPWPLAHVDLAVAISELREAASADLPGVIDRLTGEPVSLPARVAFWFRWLQLLPDESWPALARAAALPSTVLGAGMAEMVEALSGASAGAFSRYARLQIAAAAIAEARRAAQGIADGGAIERLNDEPLSLPARVAFWSRWLQLLPGESWPALAQAVAPPWGGSSAGVAEIVGALSGTPAGAFSRDARLRLAAVAIAWARRAEEVADAGELASLVRQALGGGGVGAAAGTSTALDGARSSPSDWNAVAQWVARLPEPAAAAFRAWLAVPGGSPHGTGPHPEQPARPDSPTRPRSESRVTAVSRDAREAPSGQMVHHAGLILLHPFLPRFFESTGVKSAGRPALEPDALPRAAALLHLLAAGEAEVFELELDFIKVLLGLAIDAPLPVSDGLLRDSDREEAEALLSTVIQYWSALRKTSTKGLRSSFLTRSGLLREEEQGFRLQVEPAPFDMLLGQLPWGISTVKLPWTKKAIFTEWQAP